MPLPPESVMPITDSLSITYVDTRLDSQLPPVVLLPGWCGDHRGFAALADQFRDERRVVCVNWRGHGVEPHPVDEDFGPAEQAADALRLLDELGISTFVPVSHSHGGWALLELLDAAGAERAPRAVVLDWLMRPPTPEFAEELARLQDPERWLDGCRALFRSWYPALEDEPLRQDMETRAKAYGFGMWSRSGRVISAAYRQHGTPMNRMARLKEPRDVRHLYSHPLEREYDELQQDFRRTHDWFAPIRLGGATHFPAKEIPDVVARHIR